MLSELTSWFKGLTIDKATASNALADKATDTVIGLLKSVFGWPISLVQGIWEFTQTFGIKSPGLDAANNVITNGEEQVKAHMAPHAAKLAETIVNKAATLAGKATDGIHVTDQPSAAPATPTVPAPAAVQAK